VALLRGSELADLVTGSARVIPRRAQDLGYSFQYPEIDPALRDLLAS
jgi:NAD dependent epimerase/dehydratase family enzyme